MRELGRRGVKAQVRALLESIGARVYNLSEAKPGWKRPAGLPDLWVMLPRVSRAWVNLPRVSRAFWVETKGRHGRQSAAQQDFEDMSYRCGVDYVSGGEPEVRAYLVRYGILKEGAV